MTDTYINESPCIDCKKDWSVEMGLSCHDCCDKWQLYQDTQNLRKLLIKLKIRENLYNNLDEIREEFLKENEEKLNGDEISLVYRVFKFIQNKGK